MADIKYLSHEQLLELAERESQEMIGCSWKEAQRRLATGEFRGTIIEVELRSLLFLLDPTR